LDVSAKNLLATLVKIEMQGFDAILGINWLAQYQLNIDCKRKLVSLITPEGKKLEHRGSNL